MKLFWKLFLGFGVLALLTALTVGMTVSSWLDEDARGRVRTKLRDQAKVLRELVRPALAQGTAPRADSAEGFQARIERLGKSVGVRYTVIAADGVVVADSEESPDAMGDHGNRPEILACRARPDEGAFATRLSETLDTTMVYLALPVGSPDALTGYVRVAVASTEVEAALADLRARVSLATLLAVALAFAAGYWLARHLAHRIERMTQTAHAIAAGDYGRLPLELSAHDELGDLGRALHRMSGQLQTRVQTSEEERQKLLAILASMVEGVIAVDSSERILHVNDVARELLGVRSGGLLQQAVQDTIAVPQVVRILQEAIQAQESRQEEVVLPSARGDQVVSLLAAPLRDGTKAVTGAVLVLHDLTALRQLETLRTDFVANVSHELKTPLTAICGFVETMLDDEAMDPETRQRFLTKALRQASRLTNLVQDLISLSRLESEQGFLERGRVDLSEPAQASVANLSAAAEAKELTLVTDWPSDPLYVDGDAEALRQVADNLLDNAIKYSQPKGRVTVRVYRWGDEALLEVEDTGIGFGADHAERVFERFYRVDKARSRAVGGTGLGLSIVKHVALAHGGRVSVKSRAGEGSTFSLCLPLPGGS